MPDMHIQKPSRVKRGNFSDVDYDEAMRRARTMIPFLKEHAAAQEAATLGFVAEVVPLADLLTAARRLVPPSFNRPLIPSCV